MMLPASSVFLLLGALMVFLSILAESCLMQGLEALLQALVSCTVL